MVSIGGAIGALLVAVAAPMLLSGYYELGIALTACAMLLYHRTLAGRWWLAAVALAVVVTTAAFTVVSVTDYQKNTRVMVRNFYGVVRTRDYTTRSPSARCTTAASTTAGSCSTRRCAAGPPAISPRPAPTGASSRASPRPRGAWA